MSSLRDDPAEARRVLTERRGELARLLELGHETASVVAADPQGVNGGAGLDDLQQRAMASDVARRRRLELARVEAALERVATEDYGYCLACGSPITDGRLALDPAAAFCVECAARV